MNAVEPPVRDRMAGRYHVQCAGCRAHRRHGLDCTGGPVTARGRRRVERARVARYLRSQYDQA